MKINQWLPDERPREKLLARGAASLSDAELLAIFLRIGVSGKSAVELARELLREFGSFSALWTASEQELSRLHGMGPAKCAQLQAATEMARRALHEKISRGNVLNSPTAVRDYLRLKMQSLPHEVFMALFLDAQNRVITVEELLHHNAGGVILAHNHPSGVAEPSHADETLTQALRQALALVDIRVLDHFIVAGSGVLSFAERGLL